MNKSALRRPLDKKCCEEIRKVWKVNQAQKVLRIVMESACLEMVFLELDFIILLRSSIYLLILR